MVELLSRQTTGPTLALTCQTEAPEIGWQVFDAGTGIFLSEGEWHEAKGPIPLELSVPDSPGRYRVFISARDHEHGWHYTLGHPFLLAEAEVDSTGQVHWSQVAQRTLRSLALRQLPRTLARAITRPFTSLWQNRRLLVSLVRRDLAARYRGSFGGLAWTILSPLLLMATYYFVFAEVLQSRFPGDPSREGFALYFLAGMIPWLALSEALGRAPGILLEHRNLIQKLVFPVDLLPAQLAAGAFINSLFALAVFLVGLAVTRQHIPATAALLPLLWLTQWLFTTGLAWLLAAIGAYIRDLAQFIGFGLTLWFFLTPICYPDTALPEAAKPILGKNPAYILVRAWRAILVEGHPPEWIALAKFAALALVTFWLGYAVFHKLRRGLADVL